MEALQNHENEDIYKLVYEIIDSYFGGVSKEFINGCTVVICYKRWMHCTVGLISFDHSFVVSLYYHRTWR